MMYRLRIMYSSGNVTLILLAHVYSEKSNHVTSLLALHVVPNLKSDRSSSTLFFMGNFCHEAPSVHVRQTGRFAIAYTSFFFPDSHFNKQNK